MQKYSLLGKLIAPLTAVALLTSCQTADYSPFKDRKEFQEALRFAEKGHVDCGEWKGLTLRTCAKSPIESMGDLVNTNDMCVQYFNAGIRSRFANFEKFDNLEKTRAIYETLRKYFSYEPNPFNKLEHVDRRLFAKGDRQAVLKKLDRSFIGFQTPTETYKFQKGYCENLAIFLASHMRIAGVESYPLLIIPESAAEERGDGVISSHVAIIFNSGIKKDSGKDDLNEQKSSIPLEKRNDTFMFIDPSYFKELDFMQNIEFSVGYMSTNFTKIILRR